MSNRKRKLIILLENSSKKNLIYYCSQTETHTSFPLLFIKPSRKKSNSEITILSNHTNKTILKNNKTLIKKISGGIKLIILIYKIRSSKRITESTFEIFAGWIRSFAFSKLKIKRYYGKT